MIEAALVFAAAAASPAHFAPPIGVALTSVVTETRDLGGKHFSFSSTRRITFERDGDGFVALLTLDHTDQAPGAGPGAMFQAAMAGFAGRTIRLHLDAAGKLVGIDDLDALWAHFVARIAAMGDSAGRRQRAAAIAAALGRLPVAERQAMIGSLLGQVIAGDDAALAPGSDTPVAIAARPSPQGPMTLAGRQTVTRLADGRLDLHVDAAGTLADDPSGRVSLSRDTVVDPVTGLVTARRETTVTTIGTARSTSTTSMSLSAPVS